MIRTPQLLALIVIGVVGGICPFGLQAPNSTRPANYVAAATIQQEDTAADQPSETEKQQVTESFAFIELFTSEGCSSCPSADRNLERIAAEAKSSGKNVYTLSYHVDYWDDLGWKDPYGTKQFTDRQRSYARHFESNRVYTPQMVVNGQVEFVGSHKKKSEKAIGIALRLKPESMISVTSFMSGGVVNAHWKAHGLSPNDQVRIALVQNSGEQKVNRGENARRRLTHVNIVRELKTTASAEAGQLEFSLPAGLAADSFHVVAFVQSTDAITAASKSAIAASPPTKEHSATDMDQSEQAPSDSAS